MIDFFKWFWEDYLDGDLKTVFIWWTFLLLAIFLGIATYFFGVTVIIYFVKGFVISIVLTLIIGYIFIFRNARITYYERLFDKLRNTPEQRK